MSPRAPGGKLQFLSMAPRSPRVAGLSSPPRSGPPPQQPTPLSRFPSAGRTAPSAQRALPAFPYSSESAESLLSRGRLGWRLSLLPARALPPLKLCLQCLGVTCLLMHPLLPIKADVGSIYCCKPSTAMVQGLKKTPVQ